jgi:hypothetical protein
MTNYSVIINVAGKSKKQIKDGLVAAFGDAIGREAEIVRVGEKIVSYDECRVLGHFGCVHWTDEDLNLKLEELNFAATPQLVTALKSGYVLRHIDDRMIERGWEVIEQAILETEILEEHS